MFVRREWRQSARAGRRRSAGVGVVVVAALALSACRAPDEPAAEAADPVVTSVAAPTTSEATSTSAAPTTTTTTVVATTAPPTTTTTTTTTTTAPTTTTTSPPTTIALAEQATEPIAPPPDSHADEPVIELGSISIPKIDVDMTMYEGIRLTTLDHGPGHWPGSALPGQTGNVVVGGHRTSKHRVFRNVDQLVAGDEIIFRDGADEHVYAVREVRIIEPTEVWIIDPTPTPTATLFACHPPGSTAQRIAVFADLVSG